MMNNERPAGTGVILVTFVVAALLEVIPLNQTLDWVRPEWMLLVLLYWVLSLPHRIGVLWGFLVGLYLDVLVGATLGQWALSYAFGAYKLYEVSKYATEGLAMTGFMCWQMVNLDTWNKTPQVVRDAMPAAQKNAISTMIDAYNKADEKWIPLFKERLEVVQVAPATRDKLAAGASQIWDEWAKEQDEAGRPGTEILNFVKDQVKKSMM